MPRCQDNVMCGQACNQGGGAPQENFLLPLEKYVGHSLKILDIVQKIWITLSKLLAPLVSQAGCGP